MADHQERIRLTRSSPRPPGRTTVGAPQCRNDAQEPLHAPHRHKRMGHHVRSAFRTASVVVALALLAGCTSSNPISASSGSTATTSVLIDGSPIGEALRRDTTLTIGERRLVPLHLHCGVQPQVRFNGRHWDLAATPGGPLPDTGAGEPLPATWETLGSPEAVRAYVSLGDDESIRYSLRDGTVLAIYRPADVAVEPRGCE